jgi:hypothetical protein
MEGEYECPVETTMAGWCTLIDPELELDVPSAGQMGVPDTGGKYCIIRRIGSAGIS